jgi:protein-S-isoprenylcysteine O-methyltransferase Ste14
VRSRAAAAAGSLLFFVAAPCIVAGYVPWLITRWRVPAAMPGVVRLVGAALVAAGTAVVVDSFARFALQGRGTPAPVAPPQDLVVTGLYRYVRNPMYVGVVAAILGQVLIFGDPRLLVYAATVAAVFHSWVVLYEEPRLALRFGESYHRYRAGVRRWWPRATRWDG